MIGLKLFNRNCLSAQAVVRILIVIQTTSPSPWYISLGLCCMSPLACLPRGLIAPFFSVLIATRLVPQ